ncbi:MAG: recombination mediator RecR [Bacteroidia bacterium]|nr:recombination mediator RecR [Bacteroidia bacterium]MDW8015470.1 recombination mediator RecR [Bacteroidia bacterium]
MEVLLPPSLQSLLKTLERLPGIGPRSALRIVQALLRRSDLLLQLHQAIGAVVESIYSCPVCGFWVEKEKPCQLCEDPRRTDPVLCIVKEVADVLAIERSQAFNGRYHILGGVLDPLAGVGEKDLRLAELWQRLQRENYEEVIIALGTSPEAETTAYYMARRLADWHGRLTRFASGIPVGSELSYVDPLTLSRSLRERQLLSL